jgi:hypothetical protein
MEKLIEKSDSFQALKIRNAKILKRGLIRVVESRIQGLQRELERLQKMTPEELIAEEERKVAEQVRQDEEDAYWAKKHAAMNAMYA